MIAYGAFIFYTASVDLHIQNKAFLRYDKLIHAVEYGIFTWLWYRALRISNGKRHSRWVWPLAIGASILFAVLDETYQTVNPARNADFYDLFADILGSFSIFMLFILKNRFPVRI